MEGAAVFSIHKYVIAFVGVVVGPLRVLLVATSPLLEMKSTFIVWSYWSL